MLIKKKCDDKWQEKYFLRNEVDLNRSFLTFILYVLILQALRESLDSGKSLAFPDGLLINGQTHSTINGDQGQSFQKNIVILFCKF